MEKQYGIKEVSPLGKVSYGKPADSYLTAQMKAGLLNTHSQGMVYSVVVREVSEWEEV